MSVVMSKTKHCLMGEEVREDSQGVGVGELGGLGVSVSSLTNTTVLVLPSLTPALGTDS